MLPIQFFNDTYFIYYKQEKDKKYFVKIPFLDACWTIQRVWTLDCRVGIVSNSDTILGPILKL